MTTLDVYTPWREPAAELRARHVGRADVVRCIEQAVGAHLRGDSPSHLYIFGPRGLGKSHLLAQGVDGYRALARGEGLRLITIGEDIPVLGRADRIIARLQRQGQGPAWTRWNQAQASVPLSRAIVFFEGLDRQLRGMPEQERRGLRRFVQEQELLLVATGITLTSEFTQRDTAFYGFFSPWPLAPMAPDESSELLDKLVGAEVLQRVSWSARRDTLVALAGGSPRTLVTLASSCVHRPDAWASEHLYAVVRQFTAHYQFRYRDLAPQAQQVLELLTLAPRELSPSEVAETLGMAAKHASTIMRRLVEDGVLRVRSEGRHAWYSLAEPLFRFWHEYRTSPWEETRVGWLANLIEAVLSPEELSQAWLDNPDETMKLPIEEALQKSPEAQERAWVALIGRIWQADEGSRYELVKRWRSLSPEPRWGKVFISLVGRWAADRRINQELRELARTCSFLDIVAALRFLEGCEIGEEQPKALFRRFLQAARKQRDGHSPSGSILVLRGLEALRESVPSGRSWTLSNRERATLASLPFVRVPFLLRGKYPGHPSMLQPEDILALRGPLPDAAELLGAAHRLGEAKLFTVACASAHSLPENPLPMRPAPAAHDDVVRRSAAMLEGADARALSWAASWSRASPAAFSQLLDANWEAQAFAPPPRRPMESALVALGVHAPDRLDAIAGRAEALPELAAVVERARVLVRQLQEARVARLHPELQRFAELLQAAARSSSSAAVR